MDFAISIDDTIKTLSFLYSSTTMISKKLSGKLTEHLEVVDNDSALSIVDFLSDELELRVFLHTIQLNSLVVDFLEILELFAL